MATSQEPTTPHIAPKRGFWREAIGSDPASHGAAAALAAIAAAASFAVYTGLASWIDDLLAGVSGGREAFAAALAPEALMVAGVVAAALVARVLAGAALNFVEAGIFGRAAARARRSSAGRQIALKEPSGAAAEAVGAAAARAASLPARIAFQLAASLIFLANLSLWFAAAAAAAAALLGAAALYRGPRAGLSIDVSGDAAGQADAGGPPAKHAVDRALAGIARRGFAAARSGATRTSLFEAAAAIAAVGVVVTAGALVAADKLAIGAALAGLLAAFDAGAALALRPSKLPPRLGRPELARADEPAAAGAPVSREPAPLVLDAAALRAGAPSFSGRIPCGVVAHVVGADADEMRALAGRAEPASGDIRFGARSATMLAPAIAYVSGPARLAPGSLRANLALDAALTPQTRSTAAEERDPCAEPALSDGEWIDFEAAGVIDAPFSPSTPAPVKAAALAAFDRRALEVADRLGLGDRIFAAGLGRSVDFSSDSELAEAVRRIQADLLEQADPQIERAISRWAPGVFNDHASVLDNLLMDVAASEPEPIHDAVLRRIAGRPLARLLADVGAAIVLETAEIVRAHRSQAALLAGFDLYPLDEAEALADAADDRRRGPFFARGGQMPRLAAVALRYAPARHPFEDLLGESGRDAVLRARGLFAREAEPKRALFRRGATSSEPLPLSSRAALGDLLICGRARADRPDAAAELTRELRRAADARGAARRILELGLAADASKTADGWRRDELERLAVARAVIARPAAIVLDGVAASENAASRAVIGAARHLRGRAALIRAARGLTPRSGAEPDGVLWAGDDLVLDLRRGALSRASDHAVAVSPAPETQEDAPQPTPKPRPRVKAARAAWRAATDVAPQLARVATAAGGAVATGLSRLGGSALSKIGRPRIWDEKSDFSKGPSISDRSR